MDLAGASLVALEIVELFCAAARESVYVSASGAYIVVIRVSTEELVRPMHYGLRR